MASANQISNGKQLLDSGWIPKDISSIVGLIAYERVKALKNEIQGAVDPESLGKWIPLFTGSLDKGYTIANNVVASEELGHRVIFDSGYKGKAYVEESSYGYSGSSSGLSTTTVEIPKGTTASLVKVDNRTIKIKVDSNLPGLGNRKYLYFKPEQAADAVKVSNLGQREPSDMEKIVRKEVYQAFIPNISVNTETMEDLIITMIIGRDVCLYGPMGSGKSTIAKQMLDIIGQIGSFYQVEGCEVHCNPASLFDEKFAEIIDSCVDCKIKYDSQFETTGEFSLLNPKDIKVAKVNFRNFICEIADGNDLNRSEVAGVKIPDLINKTKLYTTEGFNPGLLSRVHNGAFVINELDKLDPQLQANLLSSFSDEKIKPDMLKYSFPADNYGICTANDATMLLGPLVDRLRMILVAGSNNVDVEYLAVQKFEYNLRTKSANVKISDVHLMPPLSTNEPIPIPVEKAIVSLTILATDKYTGSGIETQMFYSKRLLADAIDATRAKLLLDKTFYREIGEIAGGEYAMLGLSYALRTRIQASNPASAIQSNIEANEFINQNYPTKLKEEESKFWCETYKHIATAQLGMEFQAELQAYEKDPVNIWKSYNTVRSAYENDKASTLGKLPFMDYLFSGGQMGMEKLEQGQITQLLGYFMKIKKDCGCKEPAF